MDPLSLFTVALGLPAPWEIVDGPSIPNRAGSISTAPSPRGHDVLVRSGAALTQSPNEVAGRGLFDPPAGAGTAGTERIAGFGFGEDGVVAGPQALDVADGQCLEVLVLGFADQGISLA